jgi:hypothetical protein
MVQTLRAFEANLSKRPEHGEPDAARRPGNGKSLRRPPAMRFPNKSAAMEKSRRLDKF